MLRKIKNLIGDLRGYGHCLICGDSWEWKNAHFIKYQESRSMFPYCTECHEKAPLIDKEVAVARLVEMWYRKSNMGYYAMSWEDYYGMSWAETLKAALHEMHRS